MARPTIYDSKYCDMIIDYFNVQPQQTVYKETYYADGGVKSKEPVVLAAQFPTFQGFANEIGVNGDTLVEWSKKYDEFSAAYAQAKAIQEKIWLINGIGGQYNAQFAQFFGKNCLGYSDKSQIDIANANDKPFQVSNLSEADIKKSLADLGFVQGKTKKDA
jgi:hypothetical protein